MGVYDSYGKLDGQLKVGACRLDHYDVGDKVYIHDGVYVTYTNVIVVVDGVFVAEFEHLWDKWSRSLQPSDVITKAVKKHKGRLDGETVAGTQRWYPEPVFGRYLGE